MTSHRSIWWELVLLRSNSYDSQDKNKKKLIPQSNLLIRKWTFFSVDGTLTSLYIGKILLRNCLGFTQVSIKYRLARLTGTLNDCINKNININNE